MTFEEMQQVLQEMLRIQRDLQESQIKQSADISGLRDSISELRESIGELRETMTANHTQVTSEIRELAQVMSSNHEVFLDELRTLLTRAAAADRKIENLMGYSMSQESTSLDIQQDVLNLKRRVTALEQQQQQ